MVPLKDGKIAICEEHLFQYVSNEWNPNLPTKTQNRNIYLIPILARKFELFEKLNFEVFQTMN